MESYQTTPPVDEPQRMSARRVPAVLAVSVCIELHRRPTAHNLHRAIEYTLPLLESGNIETEGESPCGQAEVACHGGHKVHAQPAIHNFSL
ncbi:hypothetical protein CALVIDRAFT_535144, partial [Calocera viscosa TUFC12733]